MLWIHKKWTLCSLKMLQLKVLKLKEHLAILIPSLLLRWPGWLRTFTDIWSVFACQASLSLGGCCSWESSEWSDVSLTLCAQSPHCESSVLRPQCFPPEADMIDALDFYFQVSRSGTSRCRHWGTHTQHFSLLTAYSTSPFISSTKSTHCC